jgi:hypothetical protein
MGVAMGAIRLLRRTSAGSFGGASMPIKFGVCWPWR